ncbi:MAG: AI-2E family transporter [Gemmatimonadota bacterium]
MDVLETQRERFARQFILLLAIGISFVFFGMIKRMAVGLLLAALFAGMFHPLYRKFVAWFGGRKALSATVTVTLLLIVVLVPLALFVGIVASQAVEVTSSVGPWLERQIQQPDQLDRWLWSNPRLQWLQPYQAEVMTRVSELAGIVGTFLVNSVAAATRGTASFLLSLFVMLYATFYFLISGRQVLAKLLYYVPLEPADENLMVEKFLSVTRATLKGSLVIGIVQGFLAGAAFAVAGIKGAAFWGTVMAVLSIVPAVGTSLVWIPAVIYLFISGEPGTALALAAWCIVVVGTVDNFLRPVLVGRDTKMPDLLVLISTLGGLFYFGAVGFVVGPIVAALFIAVWEIYGRAFADYLPPVALPALSGVVERPGPEDGSFDPASVDGST